MKLLHITTLRILILIFSAVSIWSAYFYFSLQNEINENIDEYLDNRKFEIIRKAKKDPSSYSGLPQTDSKVEAIEKQEFDNAKEKHQDIEVFEQLEKEYEPYRQLETVFAEGGKYFKLTVRASMMDKEELMKTIFYDVLLLYVILFSLIIFLNRVILQKLWKPFYSTLEKLQNYRLDKDAIIYFETSRIQEFRNLNDTVSRLINNNYQAYQQQKQFIENASHEIQTPLAIASGKLELFMQHPNLSSEHADIIQSVNKNLERLSSLNKSLLLLSKIDNNQFPERTVIQLDDFIRKLTEEFEQFAEYKNIRINLLIEEKSTISANKDLVEILFRNLIKNAIYHNLPEGFVHIKVLKDKVIIENSGKELQEGTEALFNRFVKDSVRAESLGLGLSIVRSIADLHNYTVSYQEKNGIHTIIIDF
jgi:signal transduction histidine kinase